MQLDAVTVGMEILMKSELSTRLIGLFLFLLLIMCTVPPAFVHSNALDTDDAVSKIQKIDLWVDAINGNDTNDGLSPTTAFRSIQRAANVAGPGATVHILPGIYRETVRPMLNGSIAAPVVYRAENGPGTVLMRGSEPSDTLTWNELDTNSIGLLSNVNPGNIYYTDLSDWNLSGPPRFIVQLSGGETVTRLPLAREPDWQVQTEWKYAEFWWAADGGSSVATCDPVSDQDPDCDISSRSTTQLIDRTNDNEPAGIEPGNLTTLGNLTGATLVALDTNEGHYTYRRKIVAHDVAEGQITVDRPCEFDSGSARPGLGWGSKYYVENLPSLIDTPGEWWYDVEHSRLYLWPPEPANPANLNIEISRRSVGFILSGLSYITLDGLDMEFFNDSPVIQDNNDSSKSYNNTVRSATLRYANIGIELGQGVDGVVKNITSDFTLENSEISHMDTQAVYLNYWWPGGKSNSFIRAGITNTVIRNNEMYDLGFRSDNDNAIGIQFNHADKLRFEGNHVYQVAQNGVAVSRSVIQSTKTRGFSPKEVKTGNILIKDNVFEKACLLNSDCGELKIQGSWPDNHVFRNLLITGNVFRNTFGWTYISEKRGRWSGGPGSDVQGMGGLGLYVDNASGVHVYRNIAYNNAFSDYHFYYYWWDGNIILYNNIAANSLNGIYLGGDTQSSINTKIANNIFINNEGYGILLFQAQGKYGKFSLDHNLYYSNGWRAYEAGGIWQPGDMAIYRANEYYQTLAAIKANTPWEDHGVEGDPSFGDYTFTDHNLTDGSWPDFHLTSASVNALDKGTPILPGSLNALLQTFKVTDFHEGSAYDIGRYEGGFRVQVSPTAQSVCPGGVARYTIRLSPQDLRYDVALTVASQFPVLDIALSSPSLTSNEVVTLTVTDKHTKIITPQTYAIRVTATGGGFVKTASVRLTVRNGQICLNTAQ